MEHYDDEKVEDLRKITKRFGSVDHSHEDEKSLGFVIAHHVCHFLSNLIAFCITCFICALVFVCFGKCSKGYKKLSRKRKRDDKVDDENIPLHTLPVDIGRVSESETNDLNVIDDIPTSGPVDIPL